ncbi:hypothetical protein [uncultured Gammaproteobacteria bacterium]|nr:hypothetical protein [uncultured Gammaproteobacteria bacterium]
MGTKKITFYQYELCIDKDENLKSIESIENGNIEPFKVNKEIIKINLFQATKFSNRFYGFSIESGDLSHYSDKVIDVNDNLKIKNNPRKNTDIEFDDQFFFLVDTETKKIHLSNNKKKVAIEKLLIDKTGKTATIKEILNRENFEENLKKISEIDLIFTELTLFNNTALNQELSDDLYNYDADSVRVIFKYKDIGITSKIKTKIQKFMNGNDGYSSLKIKGKGKDDIGLLFNSNSIVENISIEVEPKNRQKNCDSDTVFNELISKIKENE